MFQAFPGLTPVHKENAVRALDSLARSPEEPHEAVPSQIPLDTQRPAQPRTAHTIHHRHGTPAGNKSRPTVWRSKVHELHTLQYLEKVLLRPFRPIRFIPRRCIPAIASIVREICFMTTSADTTTMEQGAILWVLLPRMLLAAVVSDSAEPGDNAHSGRPSGQKWKKY